VSLQQRPTLRVLSYATAKLLRDEAESMVPNTDPEQVRKLAGWGWRRTTEPASSAGVSPSSAWVFHRFRLKASGDEKPG
jgi:hypothetical protein